MPKRNPNIPSDRVRYLNDQTDYPEQQAKEKVRQQKAEEEKFAHTHEESESGNDEERIDRGGMDETKNDPRL